MADKKITQLTDLGDGLASVDLFHIVDDPSGTPINKKITAADVFNNIPTWVGFNSTSQAITGDGATSAAAPVTLADGANGQIKTIINVSTSGTNAITITPANLRGGSAVTLNAVGETVTLIFKNSNWNVMGGHGFVVA